MKKGEIIMSTINNSLGFRGNPELAKEVEPKESHIARNAVIAGAVGAVAGTADSFRRARNLTGGEAIKISDLPKEVIAGICNTLKALKEYAKTLDQKLSPENAKQFIHDSYNAAIAALASIPKTVTEGVKQIPKWGIRGKTTAIWAAATAGLYLAYEGISSLFSKKAE